MSIEWKDYMKEIMDTLRDTNYVKSSDVPNIGLYMDQVTTFMDEYLESSKRFDSDKLLTKTMINNYTKNSLLPPPEKKKYSKDHMILLLFIYYLKNFLSISDVKSIISPMSEKFFKGKGDMSLEQIYDEIFKLEENCSYAMAKDIMKKFMTSKKAFTSIEAADEREYLQIFSFIAMLSFDVYLKKNLIENMIDSVFSDESKDDKSEY